MKIFGAPSGRWLCVRCGKRRRQIISGKSDGDQDAHDQLKKDLKLNKQKEKKR